jgi:hypothetical protein
MTLFAPRPNDNGQLSVPGMVRPSGWGIAPRKRLGSRVRLAACFLPRTMMLAESQTATPLYGILKPRPSSNRHGSFIGRENRPSKGPYCKRFCTLHAGPSVYPHCGAQIVPPKRPSMRVFGLALHGEIFLQRPDNLRHETAALSEI